MRLRSRQRQGALFAIRTRHTLRPLGLVTITASTDAITAIVVFEQACLTGDEMIDITQHLGLARKAASRYARVQGVPIEDTEEYSEAVVALIRAAEQFDGSRGITFSTYATHKIRGYLGHLIAQRKGKQPPEGAVVFPIGADDLSALAGDNLVESAVGCGDERSIVRVAVRRLPAKQREVVELWMQGMTLKQVAKQLQESVRYVEEVFNIALVALKQGMPYEVGRVD